MSLSRLNAQFEIRLLRITDEKIHIFMANGICQSPEGQLKAMPGIMSSSFDQTVQVHGQRTLTPARTQPTRSSIALWRTSLATTDELAILGHSLMPLEDHIVVSTPRTAVNRLDRENIRPGNLQLPIIDEADDLLEMWNDIVALRSAQSVALAAPVVARPARTVEIRKKVKYGKSFSKPIRFAR
ncbi:hypothetical protein FN846DRAFT_902401 [Sphaerosporella brunnea]|uniref:Uncharacterized protein n=1 Tax=Sphaerosporella brunnea TaxID=1250544 RepID=A0A5J5FA98_9PEZI|nr:hypothetical protein FN846DRAFT_902401 [Sphaerosporella brunnea]